MSWTVVEFTDKNLSALDLIEPLKQCLWIWFKLQHLGERFILLVRINALNWFGHTCIWIHYNSMNNKSAYIKSQNCLLILLMCLKSLLPLVPLILERAGLKTVMEGFVLFFPHTLFWHTDPVVCNFKMLHPQKSSVKHQYGPARSSLGCFF